jgi:tRNA-splicing ligase RtcB
MNCAANTAFANRQVITHHVREAFAAVFDRSAEELGMELIYDVAHNIAKVERYAEGEMLVHRKGATRAFGPGSPALPPRFRKTGQPVICGGSMETGSYLLVGTDRAVAETFGSTMHGSGRTMSRAQAKKQVRGEQLQQQMRQRGILVKAVSMSGLADSLRRPASRTRTSPRSSRPSRERASREKWRSCGRSETSKGRWNFQKQWRIRRGLAQYDQPFTHE